MLSTSRVLIPMNLCVVDSKKMKFRDSNVHPDASKVGDVNVINLHPNAQQTAATSCLSQNYNSVMSPCEIMTEVGYPAVCEQNLACDWLGMGSDHDKSCYCPGDDQDIYHSWYKAEQYAFSEWFPAFKFDPEEEVS